MQRFIILILLPFIISSNVSNCGCQGQTKENIMDVVEIKAFKGAEARKYVDDIADIWITMFKEYPYLYDGTIESGREYLEKYFKSDDAVILLVFDQDKIVGFSNVIPFVEEKDSFKQPFIDHNLDVTKYLYIGDVMIRKPYRGKGLLRKFFEYYENLAREKGYPYLTFVTSKRPEDHPMKPKDYRELGPIWEHFGYNLDDRLVARFKWKQVDTGHLSENLLNFWIKSFNVKNGN